MATNEHERYMVDSTDEDLTSNDDELLSADDEFSSTDEELSSNEDDSEDESLAVEPFRLMDLPLEIRDLIYEEMFPGNATFIGPTWGTPMNSFDPIPYNADPGGCGVGILWACRQTYTEAMPVLYSHCNFEFDADPHYESSVRSALHFFAKVIPKAAYKYVRYLKFQIQERIKSDGSTMVLSTTPDGDKGKGDSKRLIRLFALLKASQLRHLTLRVVNRTKYSHPPQKNSIDHDNEPYREVPDWVTPMLAINNLDRLTLCWYYADITCLGRTLVTAKLMRSTMLKNGNIWKAHDGIQILFRHDDDDCYGYKKQGRHLEFEMDIDTKGNPHLDHVRRVKILPDEWCSSCGFFASLGEVSDKGCACGAPMESFRDHSGPWSSSDWDGRPLQNFLPRGVTEDDYYQAKAFADSGFRLQLQGGHWYVHRQYGYTDSDFGDTDSLYSIHGWSDDEEVG